MGHLHELEALKVARAATPVPNGHLPYLRDHFEVSGPHGDHACFVLDLKGISVHTLMRSNERTPFLRLHVAQKVTAHVIDALIYLHEAGLIHSGQTFQHFARLSYLTNALFLITRCPIPQNGHKRQPCH